MMGWRASDGVGWHTKLQVVRAVVVAHDGAGDPSMWVGMHADVHPRPHAHPTKS